MPFCDCDFLLLVTLLEAAKRTNYSEDRGLKVRFSLATIAFDRESAQMSQILSSQGEKRHLQTPILTI